MKRKGLFLAVSLMALGLWSCSNSEDQSTTMVDQQDLYTIVSKGGDAGDYQAFTDAVRLENGDILVVFYAGDEHVTYPSEAYPDAGRICMVRSKDNGKTWSSPVTIYDDVADNRDPHISQMSDGTVVLTFFNTLFGDVINREGSGNSPIHYEQKHRERKSGGIWFLRSYDDGHSWEEKAQQISVGTYVHACSAPMRELEDGTWVYPAYHQGGEEAWGTVFHSTDKGETWGKPVFIGQGSGLYLPAETDIISLKDGSIFAALRGSIKHDDLMHFSKSTDGGKTWSPVENIGFQGHAPHFLRLSNDAIVMTYRAFRNDAESNTGYTGFRISFDEGETWQGPYLIDEFWGAYAATVELDDQTLLISYYEEGEGSAVRVIRVNAPENSDESIPHDAPVALERLEL